MKEPIYADIQYLRQFDGPAVHHVYPRSTGRATKRPPSESIRVPLTDARTNKDNYSLDEHGFAFISNRSDFAHQGIEYFHENLGEVKSAYYGECTELVMDHTGASHVIAFDHNLRSLKRSELGYTNMNEPVRFCHNDYTHESGPKRLTALLNENSTEPMSHRYAFINVWRPLMQPVVDKWPPHVDEIYSIRHSAAHEWVYFSDMTIDEVILLKCYDSVEDGRARFTPHTAIDLPSRTPQTPPRESIEVRLVAFFD